MYIKCNRYVFGYRSKPSEVKDYAYRSDDLARKTYGRDAYFSRLNQVLDFARFLGWDMPRFGNNLPPEISELPPEAVDHIFENLVKLIIDVAPVTKVMLANGQYCSVRMLCGTTPAGDLVWRCHLLTDKDGCPYVVRNDKRFKVKLRGTQIVCQNESLPYDPNYVADIFGGDQGIWPVPFLPEFFSDQAIAGFFSPSDGLIEVVKIDEKEPVVVFANHFVPWYRMLEIDRTKALPLDDGIGEPAEEEYEGLPEGPSDVETLIPGWGDLSDGEQFDERGSDFESSDEFSEDDDFSEDESVEDNSETETGDAHFTNLAVSFSEAEYANYINAENFLNDSGISGKEEAEQLQQDPATKDKAEKWFESAVTRLKINANCAAKIGAVLNLCEQNSDSQILVIQPRQKWAQVMAEALAARGVQAVVYDKEQAKEQLRAWYEGDIQILITANAKEKLFIDDLTIISASAFNSPEWVEFTNSSHTVFSIVIAQLGYEDYNLITDPELAESKQYTGPVYDILKMEKVKVKAPSKPKYVVKIHGDKKQKKLADKDKAIEFAKSQESSGKKCEISFDNDVIYITGLGEIK